LGVLPLAEADHRFVVDLGDRLGLGFQESKRQRCAQRGEYSGFVLDTVKGRLLVLPDKLEKMLLVLEEWILSAFITARGLAKIRGKAIHLSRGVNHLRVLAAEISLRLGTELDPVDDDHEFDWDRELSTTGDMIDLGREMCCVLRKGAPEGTELWPLHPSTLYSRFLRGRFQGKRMFVLSWDAGPKGYAALLNWWERDASDRWLLRKLLLVGTWPQGAEVDHQPHREILGACLASECAAQLEDLRGAVILYRNDAEAAIAALSKGSFASPTMQRSAVRLNRLLFDLDVLPRFWHVPGLTLVNEGIDGASRGGGVLGDVCVDAVAGPAVKDDLWAKIETELGRHGWRATIDLFASACNARCQRYCSRTAESEAERTDAFTMSDWSMSQCPHCGLLHDEVVYAYPPTVLARHVVNKAMQDGARIALVVPLAVTAPHWQKLLRASVVANPDRYLRVRNVSQSVLHSTADDPSELAVFVCDFKGMRDVADSAVVGACAGAYARRRRALCGGREDEEDRRRLRAELLRLEAEDGPAGARAELLA